MLVRVRTKEGTWTSIHVPCEIDAWRQARKDYLYRSSFVFGRDACMDLASRLLTDIGISIDNEDESVILRTALSCSSRRVRIESGD